MIQLSERILLEMGEDVAKKRLLCETKSYPKGCLKNVWALKKPLFFY